MKTLCKRSLIIMYIGTKCNGNYKNVKVYTFIFNFNKVLANL